MGYWTSFTLTAKNVDSKETFDAITRALDAFGIIGYALDNGYYSEKFNVGDWFTYDTAKWYQADEEIRTIAKEFPDVKFCLMCRGEDGAEWAQFFKWDAFEQIDREEFDPKPTVFEW